jgi:hypothetical protein
MATSIGTSLGPKSLTRLFTDSTFPDQVNAVTDGKEQLLGPIVCLHQFIQICHCSAFIVFRVKDPAVPQGIIGKDQAAITYKVNPELSANFCLWPVGIVSPKANTIGDIKKE